MLTKNWSWQTPICNWIGVVCGRRHPRVTRFSRFDMGPRGTIAKELGHLSFLVHLDIGNNSFYGHIGDEIGHLCQLHINIQTSWRVRFLRILFTYLNFRTWTFLTTVSLDLYLLQCLIFPLWWAFPSEKKSIFWDVSNGPLWHFAKQGLNLLQNQLSGSLPTSLPNFAKLEKISVCQQFHRKHSNGDRKLDTAIFYLGLDSLNGTSHLSCKLVSGLKLTFLCLIHVVWKYKQFGKEV